ncbi:MAG: QueT transporter family protein [Eubacteriales bacterium]|nr:QueT transporter family protein [Eubacteriales bacterium]
MSRDRIYQIILAAIITALYVSLTVPAANIAYGMIQFRLAEALTVLPVMTSAAIPAVSLGCFIANILNPQNLGLIDIVGGSLTTLVAAYLSYLLGRGWRTLRLRDELGRKSLRYEIIALLPPVILNALVVGTYLPYLFTEGKPGLTVIFTTQLSILLSQSLVIYLIGLPFLRVVAKTKFLRENVI